MCRQAIMTGRFHPRTGCAAGFLVRIDRYELNAQLLDLLDEPGQVRLIGHLAGQHRHARNPLQPHAGKQESERIAQLPAKDKPVPAAVHPVAVHVYEPHTPPGDPSSPAGRTPLGETAARPDPARPSGCWPATDNEAAGLGGEPGGRRPVRYPLDARYRRPSWRPRWSAPAREDTASLR